MLRLVAAWFIGGQRSAASCMLLDAEALRIEHLVAERADPPETKTVLDFSSPQTPEHMPGFSMDVLLVTRVHVFIVEFLQISFWIKASTYIALNNV